MPIITFMSNEKKETGQTMSVAAIATQMAIEHNYKILIVSTNFKEHTLENCFWDLNSVNNFVDSSIKTSNIGTDAGVEGLIKVVAGNGTNGEIVKNYTKIILRDRLDVLPGPVTTSYVEYERIAAGYPDILKMASTYYDMIFVDLGKRMDEKYAAPILEISDVVVVSITQRLKCIDDFMKLRAQEEFYKHPRIMLLVGRYDGFSKYNAKNMGRYMKMKNQVNTVPYNTLFFEACSEGKIIDYFLKLKNIDVNDRNYLFIKEINNTVQNIIYKIREVQMYRG